MDVFWNKLWELLEVRAKPPVIGGWFHLFFWALSIGAGVLFCRWLKDGRRYAPRVMLITSILVIVLEVYKLWHFGLIQGGGHFAFPWKYFPFQFCSTPMYVGLLAGLTRKGKVYDSLCAYLATFAVFAGLCVMLYPAQVFVPTVGINIQTMVCHGSMITIGIYLFGSGCVKTEYKTILKALPVFLVAVTMAIGLNEWAHRAALADFNMFYFSPYGDPFLVLYSNVQRALGVSNPLNLLIYVVGFTLAAYGILLFAKGCRYLLSRKRSAEETK